MSSKVEMPFTRILTLGSSLPKITGGWGLKFSYGRWSLNAQFNFRAGNKVVNRARMDAESMHNNNNQAASVNWRWRTEGQLAEIPRALYNKGFNYLGSDRFVEDASFMRLNYLSLGYSLDPKLLRRIGVASLSINLNASNLFCLTNYSGADPEVGYGGMGVATDGAKTPRSRQFTARVQIGF